MKKKILLLTVAIALFVCLFAISVSAADFESAYTGDVTTYGEGPDWANLEDTASTAVIKKANGEYVRIPAYYIFKANGSSRFEANGSNFDFAWISGQVGEELALANLVAIEVPQGTSSFSGQITDAIFSSLEELVIPTTISSLPQKLLRDNTVIKKVFIKQTRDADGNVQGTTSLPSYFADMNTSGKVSSLEYFKFELDYATSIGSGAFSKSAIKEIVLEGPITSIGNAFSGCQSLKTVKINNTGDIITIAGQAFKDSIAITSVTLNGISLSSYLFENVKGAEGQLTIVATNVGKIGDGAFKNALNIVKVEISGPITSVGGSIFGGCHNLADATIISTSATPATGGSDAFNGIKGIKNVTLSGIQIGSKMFHKVTTLEKVNLTNYTTIGTYAFSESNIASFTVPAGVTFIGEKAFQNCKSLTNVTFEGNTVQFTEIAQATFENCTVLTDIVIPEGVTTLGNCAFKGSGLTSVSFPTTLTTLGGGEHFYNTKLTTVTGLENTKLTSISYAMFRGISQWTPDVIQLPDTVKSIAQYGFADVGAKVFKIGAGVETIGVEAFVNCGKVEAYYLPDTVTSIGDRAFNNKTDNNFIIFVVGNNDSYLNTVKSITGAADIVTLEAYEADKDAYASGKHVVSGCNACVVFYDGAHAMAGKEAMQFTSYFDSICFTDNCTRRGCDEAVVVSTINPIFYYVGYSCTEVAINGKYAMSQFFRFDEAACDQYVEKTGATFEYGLVASISANPLTVENESLIADGKTIVVPSSGFAHDLFGIGLSGISEAQKATGISFCAYVIDGGKVFYLDHGKTVDTIEQKSFDDVLALQTK